MGIYKFGNKYLPSAYKTQFEFRSHFSGEKVRLNRPGNMVFKVNMCTQFMTLFRCLILVKVLRLQIKVPKFLLG
jgi:hypothetical protein